LEGRKDFSFVRCKLLFSMPLLVLISQLSWGIPCKPPACLLLQQNFGIINHKLIALFLHFKQLLHPFPFLPFRFLSLFLHYTTLNWRFPAGCMILKGPARSIDVLELRILMLLLMQEILHQLIGSLYRYLQGFIHPR